MSPAVLRKVEAFHWLAMQCDINTYACCWEYPNHYTPRHIHFSSFGLWAKLLKFQSNSLQEFPSHTQGCLLVVLADSLCQAARSVWHHALSLWHSLSATWNVHNALGLWSLKIDFTQFMLFVGVPMITMIRITKLPGLPLIVQLNSKYFEMTKHFSHLKIHGIHL